MNNWFFYSFQGLLKMSTFDSSTVYKCPPNKHTYADFMQFILQTCVPLRRSDHQPHFVQIEFPSEFYENNIHAENKLQLKWLAEYHRIVFVYESLVEQKGVAVFSIEPLLFHDTEEVTRLRREVGELRAAVDTMLYAPPPLPAGGPAFQAHKLSFEQQQQCPQQQQHFSLNSKSNSRNTCPTTTPSKSQP